MVTQNLLNNGLSGATGTGKFVGNISPEISTSILDVNGNPFLGITATGSAVNYFTLANAATGNNPGFSATGSDTNIGINFTPKGNKNINFYDSFGNLVFNTNSVVSSAVNSFFFTNNATGQPPYIAAQGSDTNINLYLEGKGTGGAWCTGSTSGSTALMGVVGEVINSNIAFASAISLTNATPKDITSISLTKGNWQIIGNVSVTVTGSATFAQGWISGTSATVPDQSLYSSLSFGLDSTFGFSVPMLIASPTTTTTYYLSTQAAFTTGTATACGTITAIRMP